MSLVERLGYRSLNELYENLNNNEILEWASYDMVRNPEWREKAEQERAILKQVDFTPEQEAEALRDMFAGLGHL